MAGLLRMAGWRRAALSQPLPAAVGSIRSRAAVSNAQCLRPALSHPPTISRQCLCASFSSAAEAGGTEEGASAARVGFGKLAGRAPKGAQKRKPRPTKKRVAGAGAAAKVSAVELRALGKELGWDDEMIKNPDLLDILLVESARRQEDAARLKDTALFTALAGRLDAEFRTTKNLWNDTGGYGNKLSQFKPASAVRGPPPKSAKTLGADKPQEGDPITVDLSMVEAEASPDSPRKQQHAGGGGDDQTSR